MKYKNGFTLIEILVALAVFAILATITSSAMYYAFNTRARVTVQADQLASIQLAISLIERDTWQAVNRSVYRTNMQKISAFTGKNNYFELTRSGISNPQNSEQRSTLQRVAWLCNGSKLIRRSWVMLDTPDSKQFEDKVFLSNLTKCSFSYLNHTLQVLPEWRENAVQSNQTPEPLPKAIQFNFALSGWGNFSFLFTISRSLYVNIQT